METLLKEIDRLKSALEKEKQRSKGLVSALEFYAKYDHPLDLRSASKTELDIDGGKKAREALNNYSEGGSENG